MLEVGREEVRLPVEAKDRKITINFVKIFSLLKCSSLIFKMKMWKILIEQTVGFKHGSSTTNAWSV